MANANPAVDEIFAEALQRDAQERSAFLDVACANNPELRQRIERLLRAHGDADSFLESPVPNLVATRDETPITECAGSVIGPYKLLEQIGEGGFGVVFMAEQHQPMRRKVALKVLKPGMDTRQVVARFEAERQALALMDHPNIARVFDGGETDSGRPYFVMELVRGIPITDFCDQNHLPIRERLELFVSVCQAVQHAHQKGVIHRDLKPSNVMVTLHDNAPVVKVIDFGIAKAMGQQLTEKTLFTNFAQLIGTPVYMSPEQAQMSGLDMDTRTDVYSLGVVLYELLTGTTPFDKERLGTAAYDEMRRIIREEEPAKPSTRLSELARQTTATLTPVPSPPTAGAEGCRASESRRAGSEGGSAAARRHQASSLASIAAHRHTEPTNLRKLVRGELDWIVMKAMEKDRNRRYETASAFAADVQRYLHDQTVLACPPTAAYRFRKLVRRNKRVFAAGAATVLAVVLAVVGLAVSNVLITQEKNEKEIALQEKEDALKAAKTNFEEAKKQEALAKDNEKTANEQRQEAHANLKEALAAVDQMLTRVSEERLQDAPQMEPVRRDLLQDALKFYQKFLERRSDDPGIRREAGLAYVRMGSLHHRFGDYRQAEESYHKGFAMLEELEAESPLEADIRARLVGYHIEFSWTLANQGKQEEREKTLREAVALAEKLRKEFPDAPQYRDWLADANNRLANAIAGIRPIEAEQLLRRNLVLTEDTESWWHRGHTYQSLGLFLINQRRNSEAEAACRQAVAVFENALAKSPSDIGLQVDLANALRDLARAVDANGRPQEADEIYRRAIPVIDKFAADFPAGPHYRWGQFSAHFFHASLLKKLKQLTEAEKEYRYVVQLAEKLADDFPTLQGYRWTAVDRRRDLAMFLVETGRSEEAKQEYAAAAPRLTELTAPERAKALKGRGHFYGELGEWDKAAADLTAAIELGSEDVLGVWYPLAVLHLNAGRTNDYRSLCELLLQKLGQSENVWVVVTCKLAPGAVSDLSRPVQIAERLVAREPQNAEYVGVLGDLLYRKGDLEGAVQRLEASIRDHRGVGIHWRKLCLAMAYHRLGRSTEAQQLVQEVTEWMEKSAQVELSWAHRMDLELLRRQADELLKQEFKEGSDK